jgi:multisubunit Na+/H+ antiporter MnhB subunit
MSPASGSDLPLPWDPASRPAGRLTALVAGTLGAGLGAVVWHLPEPPAALTPHVAAALPESGVQNPVTAVLLNFRGYDTLLEVAVLVLAAVGAQAVSGSSAGRVRLPPADLFLAAFFRLFAPLAIVVAGYLLWVGKHAPGGAFQAGAILAAAGILAALTTGFTFRPTSPRPSLVLTGGLLMFCAVGLLLLHIEGNFLKYPADRAGALILGIEAAAALSIAAALIALFILCVEDSDASGICDGPPPGSHPPGSGS